MKLTVPLGTGTLLSNVRYYWIVAGVKQAVQTSGITQPDPTFPVFQFDVTPPSGADELVAYDDSDTSNWNVGGYKIAALNIDVTGIADRFVEPPPTPAPTQGPPSIVAPVTTFRSVYEAIVRRLGYNPKGDAVKEDLANNILVHINEEVELAWNVWDWPQLNVVEWRAFRQVWLQTTEFHAGDECYYFGDDALGFNSPPRNVDPPVTTTGAGYYVCNTDAPIGTKPTNPGYFTLIDPVDRYLSNNTPLENPIGSIVTVYSGNPRSIVLNNVLPSSPSSKGIDVCTTADVVWVRYRIPISVFTLRPFVPGATPIGSTYYDPQSGNCFIYSGTVNDVPVGTLVPFPAFLSGYVKPAAYADMLMETSRPSQTKVIDISNAKQEALENLQREIDLLSMQGQRTTYEGFRRYRSGSWIRPELAPGVVPTI